MTQDSNLVEKIVVKVHKTSSEDKEFYKELSGVVYDFSVIKGKKGSYRHLIQFRYVVVFDDLPDACVFKNTICLTSYEEWDNIEKPTCPKEAHKMSNFEPECVFFFYEDEGAISTNMLFLDEKTPKTEEMELKALRTEVKMLKHEYFRNLCGEDEIDEWDLLRMSGGYANPEEQSKLIACMVYP